MGEKTISRSGRKLAARLAAVQALYDMEMSQHGPTDVIAAFTARGKTAELEGEALPADPQLFTDIVRGVLAETKAIDTMIAEAGRTKRAASRYEALMRAILRAGAFELWRNESADPPLVISNYLTVTDSFYDRTEIGLVNAVLDSLAKTLRPAGGQGGTAEQAAEVDPLETPIGQSGTDDPTRE
ncbi:transcription antitermination factor NusB [Marivibrio halodurans]|uniref:Transcription antitermination factor NusB n=1 Tax=Marivibrio halodurans TaxID=2039722 RepID=A0A8J7V0Z5_9PROT|nr:transcription antitermination factor NusB [Marivibrio halodurans]MBP5855795.1 transcription antitermination factor NusB [Marivibrio halodurans]